MRGDLCAEAIRLGRLPRRLLPDKPEVGGLLAQMLLTPVPAAGGHQRRPCRGGFVRRDRLPQILALYGVLDRLADDPMVT